MKDLPTLISMVDQFATAQLSQVGFCVTAKLVSACRRRMLTMVTLRQDVWSARFTLGDKSANAYNVPTRNMAPTPSFFFQCIFKPESCQMGTTSMNTSSPMEMPAFDQLRALMSTQVPLCSPSHRNQ